MARKRKLLRHTHSNDWSTHSSSVLVPTSSSWKRNYEKMFLIKNANTMLVSEVSLHWSGGPGADGKPPQQFPTCDLFNSSSRWYLNTDAHANWVSGTEPEHHWPIVRLICVLLRGSSPPLQCTAAHAALDMDVKWLTISLCAHSLTGLQRACSQINQEKQRGCRLLIKD